MDRQECLSYCSNSSLSSRSPASTCVPGRTRISAIRADQSEHRAKATEVGWDRKFGLVKVNPLLRWTKRDVWAFLVTNHVPYNPLHDQGYDSIGCTPCTLPGQGRDGRWAGLDKTECGIHVV